MPGDETSFSNLFRSIHLQVKSTGWSNGTLDVNARDFQKSSNKSVIHSNDSLNYDQDALANCAKGIKKTPTYAVDVPLPLLSRFRTSLSPISSSSTICTRFYLSFPSPPKRHPGDPSFSALIYPLPTLNIGMLNN